MTWCISCMRQHEDGHPFLPCIIRINYLYLWTTMSLERILLQGSFTSKVAVPRSLPRYQLKIPNSIRHAACHLEIRCCSKLMTWCLKVKEHLFGTYTFLFIPFCLKINCQNWSWDLEGGWVGAGIGAGGGEVRRGKEGWGGEEVQLCLLVSLFPSLTVIHMMRGKLNTARCLWCVVWRRSQPSNFVPLGDSSFMWGCVIQCCIQECSRSRNAQFGWGRYSHMKGLGMLVVPRRGQSSEFWYSCLEC